MTDRVWIIPEHRLVLDHERGLPAEQAAEQGANQNAEIVGFAQFHAPEGATEYGVEVVYKLPDMDYETASAREAFDALLVDVVNGQIVETYPPYEIIGEDGRVK